jgi:hypothetical protein
MPLGAPAAARPTQTMIERLRPQRPRDRQILVIRPSPLCRLKPAGCAPPRHADAHAQPWSRPIPATPSRPQHAHHLAPRPGPDPTCRPSPSGRNATTPFARQGNQPADPATATRSETANRSPPQPAGDRSTDPHAEAPDPAAPARPEPTSHHSAADPTDRIRQTRLVGRALSPLTVGFIEDPVGGLVQMTGGSGWTSW